MSSNVEIETFRESSLRRSPKLTHFCSREVTQEESLIPEPFVVEPGVRRLAQAGFPRISPGES